MSRTEARIVEENTVVVLLSELAPGCLPENLCGSVLDASSAQGACFTGKAVVLCGDLSRAPAVAPALVTAQRVSVLAELSHGDGNPAWPVIGVGRLPRNVHGVGVFYPRFFDPGLDFFARIHEEHAFQELTESTKPGRAHRTGIYLTPVVKRGEELHFRLLRCSTNLSGPTDDFRATDHHIVGALNQEATVVFRDHAPLNHVLAQVYHNTAASPGHKQTKAKIRSHADKTKDMPDNGIMAFCTFYDRREPLEDKALTRLVFRRKPGVEQLDLPERFEVTLQPGSVFFMPLSTNRWYTHEIRSSALDAAELPTRLGYVVRCSATEAVHRDGQTYLSTAGGLAALEPPTAEGMAELRHLYAEENRSVDFVDYGARFSFSMNRGDYEAPLHRIDDAFRCYPLPLDDGFFHELWESIGFEPVAKGRQGAVLVWPDEVRGVPIVRTTTRYEGAAQCFAPVHVRLGRQIREHASLGAAFNNVLAERYTNAYATMGFHSDQAQDLEAGTHIALFTCYRDPRVASRRLVVESKDPGGGSFELPLAHHSVVVFSLDTNRRFRHKIVLDRSAAPPENDWLGLTFRTSRTYVRVTDGSACFEDGTPLRRASDDEKRVFYGLRRRENQEVGFVWPEISYTVSESDLMRPVSS